MCIRDRIIIDFLKLFLISSFDYRSIQLAYINASQSKLRAIFNLKNMDTELVRLIGDWWSEDLDKRRCIKSKAGKLE